MDELRESSLLFSLEGLLETERERVQREAREAERRREEELKRVADAAERRRVSQEREREARSRREALERERERLEAERLEAMKRATVERARIEAEARVRLVEAEEQRKHELHLAKLQGESRAARYRAISWLCAGASVMVVAAGIAAFFGWIRPAQAARARGYESVIAESRLREQAGEQALRQQRAENAALRDRLRLLESRGPAAAPPGLAVKPPSSPSLLPSSLPPPHVVGGAKKRPCGDSGDPLDDCLR